MPLNRKIEDRSITALQSVIDAHPTMEGYINRRDKELSWDGYIRIYQSDTSDSDKRNYDDDIPIQIKGHIDWDRKNMIADRIKCPVELDDLRVYFRKSGCLYFVMYMNEDGTEVELFYSSLYPSKIKLYLDEAERKGNKQSISIPFVRLEKDAKSLYILCKQFSFETRKQGSGLGQIVPKALVGKNLSKVKTITATSIGGATPYDLLKRINTGDAVLYGSIDESGIQYPMQVSQIVASVKNNYEIPVCIGDKQYYSSFEMISTTTAPDVKNFVREGTHIIKLSPNLTVTFKEKTINIKIECNSDLIQLKKDAEFALELFERRELSVFGERYALVISKIEEGFKEQLQNIVEAGSVLEEVGCYILIPFKELTEKDREQIDLLCNIKAGRVHFKESKNVHLYYWQFRDRLWPIVILYSEDGIALYEYIFNTRFAFTVGSPEYDKNDGIQKSMPEDAYIVPNYLRTEPSVLAKLYSYDYESMYEQIDRSVFNEYTADELNGLSLNLIAAYDISGNEKMLDLAEEILNRLIEVFPKVVHYPLNLAQIEVRKKGKLSDNTVSILDSLKDIAKTVPKPENENQADIEKVFSYCIAVVKNDLVDADSRYKKLSKADRKGVDDWPIRTLHLKLSKE